MWLLTVIDDGGEAKLLEVKDDLAALNIQTALVMNGMVVKREKG